MGKFEKKPQRTQKKSGSKKTVLLVSVIAAVVLVVGVFAAFLLLRDDGKIVGNLYVAGVDVGGMTKEEAKQAISERLKLYGENTMEVDLYGRSFPLYTTTYDPDHVQLVDIFGKPMDPSEATEATQDSSESSESSETEPESSETEPETEATEPTEKTPEDAPLDADGKPLEYLGRLTISPADANVALDVDAAVNAAFKYGRKSILFFSQLKVKTLSERHDLEASDYLTVNEEKIRSILQAAADKYGSTLTESTVNATAGADKAIHITFGTKESKLDVAALYQQLLDAYIAAEFHQQYTMEETFPAPVDLDKLYSSYCTAPVNAVCDEGTYEITDGAAGYGFEMADAVKLLDKAKPGESVTITMGTLEPQYTREKLEATLFHDVLGYVESPHSYNPPRTRNLELACEQINGLILKPGETFSFNKVVGQRTAERGFQEAGVYVGADTVDQLGGGVCQVASTVYYCTLQAELEVIERTEHRYVPAYIPWGMDATVYWGSLDYQFRNNSSYPIRIEAECNSRYVIMKFVGTETRDYTLKFESDSQITSRWEEKIVEMTPEEAAEKGYKDGQVIVDPYSAAKVKTYKYKYDKDGKEIACEFIDNSSYARRDKEIVKIVQPEEPTEPSTEPTEPSTAPTTAPTEPSTEPTEPTEPTPEEP